jgi:hypothetical protein
MTCTVDESIDVSDDVDKMDEYMTDDKVEVEEGDSDSIVRSGKAGIMRRMARIPNTRHQTKTAITSMRAGIPMEKP